MGGGGGGWWLYLFLLDDFQILCHLIGVLAQVPLAVEAYILQVIEEERLLGSAVTKLLLFTIIHSLPSHKSAPHSVLGNKTEW